MKKISFILLSLLFLAPAFTGCDEDDTDKAPELPPVESMVIDFSNFSGDAKFINEEKLATNFNVAALTVYFWNFTVGSIIAVPVAAFNTAFLLSGTPEYIGNNKWQWSYTVTGFAGAYNARLTGEVRDNDVKWEMYITKTGIGAYPEFKWFEGTSAKDRNTGQWTLYHSYQYQEEVIVVDWLRIDGKFSQITYTYVRELNDNRVDDNYNGSYIRYGLQDGNYDAYYRVHAYTPSITNFADTYIEWNTSQFYGHVKANHVYQDDNWHCWDGQGNDVDCTN